jgi:hypothetical protein
MAIEWIFDSIPASGARTGGLAQAEVFHRDVDTFVREVLQNARDQRVGSEPVVVRFLLEDLSGAALDGFLSSIRWDQLEGHLEAVAREEYVTISPRVEQYLEQIRSNGALRILRIDDYATRGLVGGEDDVDSNFNALCRHTLITSGSRRESGGSFGLGKSVLWLFSGLSTVLFYSVVQGEQARPRFFGRSLLAWHATADGEWEGSGWLGEPEVRPNGRRSISVWDSDAEHIARDARLERVDLTTGTSILILAFDDPALELERSIPELCESFAASAARWFWPAISSGQMQVVVEGRDGSGDLFQRLVAPTPEVIPFLVAQDQDDNLNTQLSEPGQVAERLISLAVPAQRPERFNELARRATVATAKLRIRTAQSGEQQLENTVALQRGTGMVVSYWMPFGRFATPEQAFHATVQVGGAYGDADADHAAEEFLRASEPVAHSEWTPSTDRIKAEYVIGAQTALRQFLDSIGTSIRDCLRESPSETSEGPDALKRMFPLPGVGGGSVAREPFRLSDTMGNLNGDTWSFGGTYSRSQQGTGPWNFYVSISMNQEGGGSGERLRIDTFEVDIGSVLGPDSTGGWEVSVPASASRVEFRGAAAPVFGIPPDGMRRAGVLLDVRPLVRRPHE